MYIVLAILELSGSKYLLAAGRKHPWDQSWRIIMPVPVGTSHLRKTLYPIFVIAALFGVQMFEYRVVVLNYVQYIVSWTFYTTMFWYLWIWSDLRTILNNHTYQFIIFSNSITSLMATALTLQHKKRFQRVLEDLTIINESFRVLNIPNDCSKLERFMWKLIRSWCIAILYSIMTDGSWMTYLFGKVMGCLLFLTVDYPHFVNSITYIIICLILSYTKSRFQLLNRHIEKLVGQKATITCWNFQQPYEMSGQLNPINIRKRKQEIFTLMHIHAELCRTCRDLNTIFGVQITFEIASYFVYMSGLVIYLFNMYDTKSQVKTNVHMSSEALIRLVQACTWAFVYLFRLIYFNHICESVSAQALKTAKLMHGYLNCVNDPELQSEVRQFILYIIYRPLRFHAAGLFCFGYEFIHMFLGGIATVVVLIVQSKSSYGSSLGSFTNGENITTDAIILPNMILPLNSTHLP